jgi:hypothetical protein
MKGSQVKRFFLLSSIFILINYNSYAQGFQDPYRYPEENVIKGGVGMTWINNSSYTTFTLSPEFNFGKIGIGFYIQFLLDNQNNFQLREDEFKDGAGILRMIQYIRLGHKYDNFFARVGRLDLAMLGNGFLMWNYNNGSNYDKRKIGLSLDADFSVVGFESIISNLYNLELAGGNVFVRPFRWFTSSPPILKNFRFYSTFIRDNDLISPEEPEEKMRLDAYGLGADLIFLDTPILKSGIYYEYGAFIDYGSGNAIGVNIIFPELVGLFNLAAKFEKRFLNDQFIPNFFGPFYELDRELNPYLKLESAKKNQGYFGQLTSHIIQKVRLIGSFQRLNGIKDSGILHFEALAPDFIPRLEMSAYFDKIGVETIKDLRTLDINTSVTALVGFRITQYLLLTTVYRWYWIETEKGVYKPIRRIEPGISFSIRF